MKKTTQPEGGNRKGPILSIYYINSMTRFIMELLNRESLDLRRMFFKYLQKIRV